MILDIYYYEINIICLVCLQSTDGLTWRFLGGPLERAMASAECLFNTAVPLTVRSATLNSPNPNNFANFYSAPPPFFTTNVTPVQFQDDQGRRVNSVVVEIYLHTIVANKKVRLR